MPEQRSVKIAILGAGTAGLKAYQEAKKRGVTAVVIHHGPQGTTCARVGCMPSKMLVHAAHMAQQGNNMECCGIRIGTTEVDMPAVLRYVRGTRDWFVDHVLDTMDDIGDDLILGQARFLEPNLLEVGGVRIRTEATIIATGSHVHIPENFRLFENRIITSNTLFEQEDLPRRIGVIGMGAMGTELAQALARLGIEITAVEMSNRIGLLTDPEVIRVAADLLREDMELWMESSVQVEEGKDGSLILQDGAHRAEVDRLLISTGRRPNLSGLGLEEIGVEIKDGRVEVDEATLQIKGFPIYLAGDANGIRPILHEATFEGRRALAHALGEVEEPERLVNLGIIFMHPQIAFVGSRWGELQQEEIRMGQYDFSDQARARIDRQNKGLMRLYAGRESGRLIGAEMIAPGGEHMAHWLALAIGQRMTVEELLRQPFYHPVVEEGLRACLATLA